MVEKVQSVDAELDPAFALGAEPSWEIEALLDRGIEVLLHRPADCQHTRGIAERSLDRPDECRRIDEGLASRNRDAIAIVERIDKRLRNVYIRPYRVGGGRVQTIGVGQHRKEWKLAVEADDAARRPAANDLVQRRPRIIQEPLAAAERQVINIAGTDPMRLIESRDRAVGPQGRAEGRVAAAGKTRHQRAGVGAGVGDIVDRLRVGVVRCHFKSARPVREADVPAMTNAAAGRVEILVEIVEALESRRQRAPRNRDGVAQQVLAAERIAQGRLGADGRYRRAGRAGSGNDRDLDLLDQIEVARIHIDELGVQVRPFRTRITQLQHGIAHDLVLDDQVPVLHVGDVRVLGDRVSRNAKTRQVDEAVGWNVQSLRGR